jgi:hypothetical protein
MSKCLRVGFKNKKPTMSWFYPKITSGARADGGEKKYNFVSHALPTSPYFIPRSSVITWGRIISQTL